MIDRGKNISQYKEHETQRATLQLLSITIWLLISTDVKTIIDYRSYNYRTLPPSETFSGPLINLW